MGQMYVLSIYLLRSIYDTVFQHFINNCPERARPPQEYLCKICNNVRERFSSPVAADVSV